MSILFKRGLRLTHRPPSLRSRLAPLPGGTSALAERDKLPSINLSSQQSEARLLETYISQTIEGSNDPAVFGLDFWAAVKLLARTRDERYMELYVKLFDLAKSASDSRAESLRIVGNYLYGLQKVRLDPVNEVEYLDALVEQRRPYLALKYWRSRKNAEDVRETIYYTEMGVLFHLEAGLWTAAKSLAEGLVDRQQLSPRLALEMAKMAAQREKELVELWTERLFRAVQRTPVQDPEELGSFEEIKNYLRPISRADLQDLLTSLLISRNWSLSLRLIQEWDLEVAHIASSIYPTIRYTRAPEESITELVSEITTRNGSLLFDERFWAAWLCSLARTGEQDQIAGALSSLSELGVSLSRISGLALVNTLVKRNHTPEAESCLTKLGTGAAAAPLVRFYARTSLDKLNAFLAETQIDGDTALAIIRVRNPVGLELARLGVSPRCWQAIWRRRLAKKPREVLEVMLANGNFKPNLKLAKTVARRFLHSGDWDGGVAALLVFAKHGLQLPAGITRWVIRGGRGSLPKSSGLTTQEFLANLQQRTRKSWQPADHLAQRWQTEALG